MASLLTPLPLDWVKGVGDDTSSARPGKEVRTDDEIAADLVTDGLGLGLQLMSWITPNPTH